ncbi:DUF6169 family protein [Dyadobacter alkalitolerans]|uniref:DUF6169 family protein n=1 Tax=Dyadobacter alkalitolerans TaxID=492736 RepID=UPI0035B69903
MVRNTIFAIINQFLSNYPSKAIVFICDNKDSRERCRQKLFSDWYQQSVRFRLTAIRKYDLDLHGVETFYGHVSLILRDDHVLHDQIKEVFLTLSDNLISKNY